jgi:hypothetical protein
MGFSIPPIENKKHFCSAIIDAFYLLHHSMCVKEASPQPAAGISPQFNYTRNFNIQTPDLFQNQLT